jgi:uncharacterized protein YjbI with pentapeptide repeats
MSYQKKSKEDSFKFLDFNNIWLWFNMLTKEESWARLRAFHLVYQKMPKGKWDLGGLGATQDDMSGYDLEGADFSGAYLGDGNFSGALLNNANFSKAELYEAKFIETNLSGANLSRAELHRADLSLANLSEANLSCAYLNNANLGAANLNGANLQGSILEEVNLNRANLSGADITGSTFWGVSTAGWKIDGIKAEYVYFCRSEELEKETYRRTFQEGQFEALFKSLPTVELIFVEGLNPTSLFTLSMIIEKIGLQNPSLGVKMAVVRKNEFETRIGVKINNDEQLIKVGQLLHEAMDQAICSIPTNLFPSNIRDALEKLPQQHHSSIVVNMVQPTFQFIKADGSTLSSVISQVGTIQSSMSIIIKNYAVHKEEVDSLFGKLKDSFSDYEASMRNALTDSSNRLIEAIRKGKDIDAIQKHWEEIKEGVKTGGAAVTIIATIGRLLGLM